MVRMELQCADVRTHLVYLVNDIIESNVSFAVFSLVNVVDNVIRKLLDGSCVSD